ncbi:hypothetical protein [Crossiella cryophila]|uniref:Uncharacterized protein n=1 Tax=Crossiella cryophila TaxID=43355 RepID=A0A7W7CJG4_9PSEU|nr:hypothetical protein [Crossiella cryophila]MBB4682349.1 hypothetical protein [Crossiella cryophila]
MPGVTQTRRRWLATGILLICPALLSAGFLLMIIIPAGLTAFGTYAVITGIQVSTTLALGWAGVFLLCGSAAFVRDHVDLWALKRLRRISIAGSWTVSGLCVLIVALVIVVPWAAGAEVIHPLLFVQLPAMLLPWAVGGMPRGAIEKVEARIAQGFRVGWGPVPHTGGGR